MSTILSTGKTGGSKGEIATAGHHIRVILLTSFADAPIGNRKTQDIFSSRSGNT
jgi:hypothetical protein